MSKMISWFKPAFWGKEEEYVLDALRSTWISDGQYVEQFERELCKQLSIKHAITVNNGTSALHLALLTLQIRSNDEIIVPGYTFAAPVNMIKMMGAIPVYVDVDENTWCIDESQIEAAITEKTKAIIAVHTYGNVCNMPYILKLAKQYHLPVIEDAAEAIFSKREGQFSGTFGDIGCFSFQATKTLTMGEGGAVTLSDDVMARRARIIRNHGVGEKRYWHSEIGHNFRLTNYQAALGYSQFQFLEPILFHKRRVINAYRRALSNTPGIKFQKFDNSVDPVVWAVALQLDSRIFGSIQSVQDKLQEENIETRSGFVSFSDMPQYNAPCLTVSKKLSDSIISLPSYTLITDEEIEYVCKSLINLRTRK